MKKYFFKSVAVAVFALTALGSAHATAVVSNVSYTAKSITFTETGDLSGYATPDVRSQFGIVYTGNLVSASGHQANTLTGSLLGPVSSNGNTGKFGQSTPYTWFQDSGTVFSGTPFTVSWASSELNTAGSGKFDFIWGNGLSGPSGYTILNSVQVVRGVVQNQKQNNVPEPESLALVGLGLAGLGLMRRKAKQA